MMVETVGVRVGLGAGIGRGVGQALLAQAGVGRPARVRWRLGAALGTVLTWRGGRNGRRCVSGRCAQGGTQTVMAGHTRRDGEGAAITRCPKGGTLTVLTRRPH